MLEQWLCGGKATHEDVMVELLDKCAVEIQGCVKEYADAKQELEAAERTKAITAAFLAGVWGRVKPEPLVS
eukprot:SAG31_NODE_41660_length_275_cov_0.585227_1_plen_70_part_10